MDYLVKVVIFSVYMTSVYFAIDYMINLLKFYFSDIIFLPLLCQFGVLSGLNIFLAIVITGFLFKQTLSFWK
jgi:predicted outer membrane lipoprotein